MKRFRPSFSLLFALVGVTVSTASATTSYTSSLGQLMNYQNVTVNVGTTSTFDSINLLLNGSAQSDNAALMYADITYKASGGATVTAFNIPVFCTDIYQDLYVGSSYTYYAQPATVSTFPKNSNANSKTVDATKLLALEYLYGEAFGSLSNYYTTVTSWSTDQITGFQEAIWEIVTDNTKSSSGNYYFSLTSGNFQVTDQSNSETIANNWLTLVKNDVYGTTGSSSKVMTLEVLTSSTNQDLLFPSTTPPIPEPSTYALAGASLLAGMAGYRRLRSKRQLKN